MQSFIYQIMGGIGLLTERSDFSVSWDFAFKNALILKHQNQAPLNQMLCFYGS